MNITACPFCGTKPQVLPINPDLEGAAFASVNCNKGDCLVNPRMTIYEDHFWQSDGRWLESSDEIKQEAITLWNELINEHN